MQTSFAKIGFGGGCHWCTEAIFQSIIGVSNVEQGYISKAKKPNIYFEAVLLSYDPLVISLQKLIEIHINTHAGATRASIRSGYLSGVFVNDRSQFRLVEDILSYLQGSKDSPIITRPYYIGNFKPSREEIRNYYASDPNRPFCTRYIQPKLESLKGSYPEYISIKD